MLRLKLLIKFLIKKNLENIKINHLLDGLKKIQQENLNHNEFFKIINYHLKHHILEYNLKYKLCR